MLPTTLVSMKPVAQFDITTYSRYQARKAIVAGTTKPGVPPLQLLKVLARLQPVVDRVMKLGLFVSPDLVRVGHGLPFPVRTSPPRHPL